MHIGCDLIPTRSLTQGSSVTLSGTLAASKGKGQDVEFVVDKARTLGSCDPEVCDFLHISLFLLAESPARYIQSRRNTSHRHFSGTMHISALELLGQQQSCE